MAEFGTQATQLSDPQGRWANPVRAVEDMNIGPNPLVGIVGKVVDIFSDGLRNNAKQKAAEYSNGIIGSFTKGYNAITEAYESGQMTVAEANIKQAALSRQMSSQFPEFRDEFAKTVKDLRGMTQAGSVEDTRKAEFDNRVLQEAEVAKAGYPIAPGQSKEVRAAFVRTWQEGEQAKQKLDALYKARGEQRAQSKEDREVQDREIKDKTFTLLSDIAGSNMDSFQTQVQDAVSRVQRNPASYDQVAMELNANFARIRIGLDAAARTNPELAAGYKAMFNDMNTLGQQLIKPGAQVENSDAQLKMLFNKLKLAAVTRDPKLAGTIAISQMIPPNIPLMLSVDGPVRDAIGYLSTYGGKEGDYVPTIVGDPKLEGPVLSALKTALVSGDSPLITDKVAFAKQADLSVKQVLKQARTLAQQSDVTPDRLVGVTKFLASSEFGEYVQNSKGVDKEMLADVTYLMQQHVIQNVEKQVLDKVRQTVRFDGQDMQIKDIVDIKFTGSGLVFVPKNEGGLTLPERQRYQDIIKDLAYSQNALTTSLHIMAHGSGSRDYAAVWEKTKSVMFPTMFPEPKEAPKGKTGNAAEQKMAIDVADPATGAGMTHEALTGLLEDLKTKRLPPEQEKALRKALEQLKD